MKTKLLSTGIFIIVLLIANLGFSPTPVTGQSLTPETTSVSPTVDGAAWSIYTVESKDDVGQYASLALNPITDLPSISYYDVTTQKLHQANRLPITKGGTCGPILQWQCLSFTPSAIIWGSYGSIAFTPSGQAFVAAYDATNGINFLTYNNLDASMGLDKKVSGAIIGRYNSLKFNSSGRWQAAYYRAYPQPNQLRFAHQLNNNNGNCGSPSDAQCDVIDSGVTVGVHASLDLDSSDNPYIAYAGANGELKLARYYIFGGGNCGPGLMWQCDIINAGVNTGEISLHVPKCTSSCPDTIRIAYYDAYSQKLKYAYPVSFGGNCGPANTWECDVIDNVGYSSGGMGVSIGVWNNSPIISYMDANDHTNTTLKIARPANGAGNCGPNGGLFYTWQCDTLDSGSRPRTLVSHNVGAYTSMVLNPVGLVTIAYYDATAGDLEVAEERLQTFLPMINLKK